MYRDIHQLRDVAGISDRPLNIDIGIVKGAKPSLYGLPKTLDSVGSAVVLFLSERCATCRSLAAGFEREFPSNLWVVLDSAKTGTFSDFWNSYGLTNKESDNRVVMDLNNKIAKSIGLDTTPVGFRIENGVFTNATTIPSLRYLISILPKPLQLRREKRL